MVDLLRLRDSGESNDSVFSQKAIVRGNSKVGVIDSQLPGFNPTYGGGLLPNQMGRHVKSAMDVAHNLKRNTGNSNSNSNIVPSNMVLSNANANVNSSRKPNVINSLINSNSIGMSNGNSMGSNSMGNSNSMGSNSMGNSNSMSNGNSMGNSNSMGNKEINLHMIYADWCGYSRKALPAFEKLTTDYDGQMMNGYKLNIKKHDTEQDKTVAKKYQVKGYPSYVMEIVENGKIENPYNVSERSYDGLLNELKKAAV